MSNRCARILAAGCAAVLAATLAVTPALAAATWTIRPGGAITATSGRVTLKDTTTHQVLSCQSATATGTLKYGSGLPGTRAGSLSAVGFTHCTSPGGPQFALRATDLPWHLNLASYNAAKGVVTGTVSHIQITDTTGECQFVIDGTGGAASDGRARFRYTDSTGQLTVLAPSNLHFYNLTGCLGQFDNGDPVTPGATFTVSPKQAITSP